MISVILCVIVGGVAGGLASLVMRTDAPEGTLLNVVAGIVGALVAGVVIAPLLGLPSLHQEVFGVGALAVSLVVSLVGAVLLLAIVNVVRGDRPR